MSYQTQFTTVLSRVLVKSGIQGLGIRNSAQGIRKTDKKSRIQYLKSWIQNMESRFQDWITLQGRTVKRLKGWRLQRHTSSSD